VRVTLVDEENGEDFVDDVVAAVLDEEMQCKEIEPKEDDCLVIHRTLVIPKDDLGENWLRHNIFKSRCKSYSHGYSQDLN
jgi:hypothetical protein